MARAINGGPVAHIRTKGKGTEDQILLAHPCTPIDIAPTAHPGLPVLLGVEPFKGMARRARSLMQIAIARRWIREQSAVGRMRFLLNDQLRFGGEGQPF